MGIDADDADMTLDVPLSEQRAVEVSEVQRAWASGLIAPVPC